MEKFKLLIGLTTICLSLSAQAYRVSGTCSQELTKFVNQVHAKPPAPPMVNESQVVFIDQLYGISLKGTFPSVDFAKEDANYKYILRGLDNRGYVKLFKFCDVSEIIEVRTDKETGKVLSSQFYKGTAE